MYKLILLILITSVTSCVTSEKTAQRALTDPVAFKKIAEVVRRLNPCLVQTTEISSDTTISYDTLKRNSDTCIPVHSSFVIDTVYKESTTHDFQKISPFYPISIIKTIRIKDSVKQKDLTELRIVTDSFSFYKNAFLLEHGKTLEAKQKGDEDTAKERSAKNKANWKFLVVLSILLAENALLLYSKFRVPITGLLSKLKA